MKALLDTSVLVAALVVAHPRHQQALAWLEQAQRDNFDAIISAHTLAETYSVLTRLPHRPQISPAAAGQLLTSNVIGQIEIVALTAQEYSDLILHLAQNGIAGGATYDAVIAAVAAKTQVDQLVTLNAKDFRRVYPALAASIITI